MPLRRRDPTDQTFRMSAALTGRKFFALFLFLLASLILYPFAETSAFGYYAFRVLGSTAIVLCVYVVSSSGAALWWLRWCLRCRRFCTAF